MATVTRERELLRELVALVRGECPSLLNEDSGGDVRLSMAIDDALAAPPAEDEHALPTKADAWSLHAYVVDHAADHDDDCPGDDTCDCQFRARNEAVSRCVRWLIERPRAPQAPPASDPPGLVEVVAEFQRAHADYQRAKHEDVGQEFAWSARKSARDAVLAYHLPASPQAETKRDCTCLGACRGGEGLSPRYRCVLAPPQAETTKGGR